MNYQSILDSACNTPIVRINKLFEDYNIDVYIKLETSNPGGSHKTRIAINMILDFENKGILKPNMGQTILEATGGNTGIGIAIASAVRGYRCVLVIPDNYSLSKRRMLKALGAEVILSDSSKGSNSNGQLAMKIQMDYPDYVMLNQCENLANPEIHRRTTAQEILQDFSDVPINYFVCCIGTGGHITGVGEVLKKEKPGVQVIGVQPFGCNLPANQFIPHQIQGIAIGIIPQVLNVNIIDRMISVTFEESSEMMKFLIKKEGLLVGLSTGANLAAVWKIAEELKKNSNIRDRINILTMAYDSAIDYLDLLD
jgi:cysteine synthase